MNCNRYSARYLRQLANMLPAGIPIARCFDILASTENDKTIKLKLMRIHQQLIAGQTLHKSLQAIPDWFDVYTCHIIALGEETGKLDLILITLANYHEHYLDWQQRLRQSLLYPSILAISALLLVFLLFILVIPSFAELFQEHIQRLPLITRLLFYLSAVLRQTLPCGGVILAAILVTCCFPAYRLKLTSQVKAMLVSIPRVSQLQASIQQIRFSRHLGIALAAGTSLLPALRLIENMVASQMQNAIKRLQRRVATGIALHKAMSECPELPLLLRQMTQIGEESGKLDELLLQFADLTEKSLQTSIAALIQYLEPLIITVLGVLIGGLVIGMYLPLFNLGSSL